MKVSSPDLVSKIPIGSKKLKASCIVERLIFIFSRLSFWHLIIAGV